MRRRRRSRIDPAGVNPAGQAVGGRFLGGFAFLRLGVALLGLAQRRHPDETPEGGLDMARRAAEAVIEVEVAESRVEIVAPKQADDPAPHPDAFRIACGTVNGSGSFRQFVGFLTVLPALRLLLLGGLLLAALGEARQGR